jgi:threonyl-tRNA synthetase
LRTLQIHCGSFSYTPLTKAVESPEKAEQDKEVRFGECLVTFVTVESDDAKDLDSVTSEAALSIGEHASSVKAKLVIIYPYAHLSSALAGPDVAKKALCQLAEKVSSQGFEVYRAPFGWYKSFKMDNKGHPLAELSRSFTGKVKQTAVPKERFHKFYVVDGEGREHEIAPGNWKEKKELWDRGGRYELLRVFVGNELEGRTAGGKAPKHIEYMTRLELVDYTPESDIGHMKWYPNGVLIKDLIMDYALNKIALPWGAVKIQNPLVYRTDIDAIRKLQGEFHERDYMIKEEDKELVLRFASDPGAFPFVQRMIFTYKQMPIKIYEEAICFRKEQKGELTGLMRVRNFWMTDQHAFCSSEEQAMVEYEKLTLMFGRLMDETVAGDHWVLGFEIVEDFYEKYREFFSSVVKKLGVPAFFKLMGEMTHYYAFKNEFQSIFSDGSNLQIATVQWDVKNGERFNIAYVDKDGLRRPVPVIIHASSFGSIERALASLLESAEWMKVNGLQPMLPLWLSPEQVRIIPVNPKAHLDRTLKDAAEISAGQVRVGVDDRDMTLSKRVMEAKTHWIPYIVVVGDKELAGEELPVTIREGSELGKDRTERMTASELVEHIKERTSGFPFRPMYLPARMSLRPIFAG